MTGDVDHRMKSNLSRYRRIKHDQKSFNLPMQKKSTRNCTFLPEGDDCY